MDLTKKTRIELITICKEKKIKNYNKKNKNDIIKQITEHIIQNEEGEQESIIYINLENKIYNNKLKMIDLFAGTGAFSLAFEKTNKVEIIFSNDIESQSKQIYDINFTNKLTLKNLHDINPEDIPKHDILTGGFPCQPFSIAGNKGGFNDERSNVFWKLLSIIEYHQPKCVILENVKNIINHDNRNTMNKIISNLENKGYYVCYKILNTAEITGIPQHRERVYIVCLKSKEVFDKFNLEFEHIEKKEITEFLEKNTIPSKYYYTEKSSTWNLIKKNVIKNNTVYQYRRVYVRENKSNECPTLTANMGEGGHNVPIILDSNGIRKLTPRECFNLQGFPNDYILPKDMSDSKLYKLAGNAVSVPIVCLIANRIVSLLHDIY